MFNQPFIDNFCQNGTLIFDGKSNENHLQSYELTDDGFKLFLKGKTSVKEKMSSIGLYYSIITKDYLKERNLYTTRPEKKEIIYLKEDESNFQDLDLVDLEPFQIRDSIDSDYLTKLYFYSE